MNEEIIIGIVAVATYAILAVKVTKVVFFIKGIPQNKTVRALCYILWPAAVVSMLLSDADTQLLNQSPLHPNTEMAIKQMELKGFADYYDMLQLGSENPEAYMVAADILHMKSSEVLKFMKDNNVPADTFVPKLRQGLKDFYRDLK